MHHIESNLIFEPPQFNKKTLHHIYNSNNALIEKLKKGLTKLPATYLICYLNDFSEAKAKLLDAKSYLRNYSKEIYQLYKESVRILRKVKYNS